MQLQLKFLIDFRNTEIESYSHYGPLFTKWLPDGENDAIEFTPHKRVKIKVWFERRGSIDKDGFVKFAYDQHGASSEAIARQGVLEAGPLLGRMTYEDISEKQKEILQECKKDDPEYIQLGKEIVNVFLWPHLSRVVRVLRITYGQYWLPDLLKWNSQDESLSAYAKNVLSLKWRFNETENWNDFEPDQHRSIVSLQSEISKDFSDYLTAEDWLKVPEMTKNGFDLIDELLFKAHEFLMKKEFKLALITAVTATELGLQEFFKGHFKEHEKLQKDLGFFDDLKARRTFFVVAGILKIEAKKIEKALAAIDARNGVAHDGVEPNSSDIENLKVLLECLSKILKKGPVKFPNANNGNAIQLNDASLENKKPIAEML